MYLTSLRTTDVAFWRPYAGAIRLHNSSKCIGCSNEIISQAISYPSLVFPLSSIMFIGYARLYNSNPYPIVPTSAGLTFSSISMIGGVVSLLTSSIE